MALISLQREVSALELNTLLTDDTQLVLREVLATTEPALFVKLGISVEIPAGLSHTPNGLFSGPPAMPWLSKTCG